ncbi:MAG: hypothetical protein GY765_05395 [bacterium]|nr:hypothetical protein [bacterium]
MKDKVIAHLKARNHLFPEVTFIGDSNFDCDNDFGILVQLHDQDVLAVGGCVMKPVEATLVISVIHVITGDEAAEKVKTTAMKVEAALPSRGNILKLEDGEDHFGQAVVFWNIVFEACGFHEVSS